MKVAVFAARERGGPAAAGDAEPRDLPAPIARSVVAAVEEVGAFGPRCRAEADRLGLTDSARLSVLGDGAECIWNLADARFAGAGQVLDVYHAVEKLAEAGRPALEGAALAGWRAEARLRLLAEGYGGACEALAGVSGGAVAAALNYFAGHRDRMSYAARLRRGQAVGSGLVEGTIKQRVNLRLKRTGARWLAGGVGPFVELLAISDGPEWAEHWATAA